MVKFWSSTKAPSAPVFETQQQSLQRMSRDVMARYQRDLKAEIIDPARLEAVYGSDFCNANTRRQGETVAMMATSMLRVPNCSLNVILEDTQVTVAEVSDYQIVEPTTVMPAHDSYCQHVIATGREFSVEDSSSHPLVCDSAVTKAGTITSYLGVPVVDTTAIIVGVLCVYDDTHRSWRAADVSILTHLSFVLTRALTTTDQPTH
jgi:GAF domain-containing protein